MSELIVTEYKRLATDYRGETVLAGEEPSHASHSVTIGAGSADSNALDGSTRFVRLDAEAACHIKFGTSPTATNNTTKMVAGQTEYFGIRPRSGDTDWVIAVIQD